MSRRPDHLPDFAEPPLDEVVLGVQFEPVSGYSAVYAKDIWELFRSEFPKVQEQPILPPQFETFGGANAQASLEIHLGEAPVGSRLWFLSEDESHLLQFQSDRFITNWRKRPDLPPYPRFEEIAKAFENNLTKLERHFWANFKHQININQAEVTYINIILIEDYSEACEWFSLLKDGNLNIDTLNMGFGEVVKSRTGEPFARLYHKIESARSVNSEQRAFRLSLTYKGKPAGNNIASAMIFLADAREAVVTRFADITTDKAHQSWGRKK